MPVPDSGVPAAIGYSQHSGVPFELGIIRNHYVGRTFIQPTQSVRELGVRMKHSANRAAIEGKRIVLIDDSLVRGTTSKKIVKHDARRRRHARCISASPRRRSRIPTITASTCRTATACSPRPISLEEMREFIGADSLAFLSVDGIYRAMGEPGRDPATSEVHRPLLHRRLSDPPDRPDPDRSRSRGNCRCWRKRADACRASSLRAQGPHDRGLVLEPLDTTSSRIITSRRMGPGIRRDD